MGREEVSRAIMAEKEKLEEIERDSPQAACQRAGLLLMRRTMWMWTEGNRLKEVLATWKGYSIACDFSAVSTPTGSPVHHTAHGSPVHHTAHGSPVPHAPPIRSVSPDLPLLALPTRSISALATPLPTEGTPLPTEGRSAVESLQSFSSGSTDSPLAGLDTPRTLYEADAETLAFISAAEKRGHQATARGLAAVEFQADLAMALPEADGLPEAMARDLDVSLEAMRISVESPTAKMNGGVEGTVRSSGDSTVQGSMARGAGADRSPVNSEVVAVTHMYNERARGDAGPPSLHVERGTTESAAPSADHKGRLDRSEMKRKAALRQRDVLLDEGTKRVIGAEEESQALRKELKDLQTVTHNDLKDLQTQLEQSTKELSMLRGILSERDVQIKSHQSKIYQLESALQATALQFDWLTQEVAQCEAQFETSQAAFAPPSDAAGLTAPPSDAAALTAPPSDASSMNHVAGADPLPCTLPIPTAAYSSTTVGFASTVSSSSPLPKNSPDTLPLSPVVPLACSSPPYCDEASMWFSGCHHYSLEGAAPHQLQPSPPKSLLVGEGGCAIMGLSDAQSLLESMPFCPEGMQFSEGMPSSPFLHHAGDLQKPHHAVPADISSSPASHVMRNDGTAPIFHSSITNSSAAAAAPRSFNRSAMSTQFQSNKAHGRYGRKFLNSVIHHSSRMGLHLRRQRNPLPSMP